MANSSENHAFSSELARQMFRHRNKLIKRHGLLYKKFFDINVEEERILPWRYWSRALEACHDGKILGTIKNVNFLEKQNEKIEENTISKPTISKILGRLELDQELIEENIADVCSMGKQKWGRPNPTKPSPASKVVKKKKKGKDMEKLGSTPESGQGMLGKSTPEVGRQKKAELEKSKAAPKYRLGSSDKTTPEVRKMKKVMLKANLKINPETGVP